MVLQTFCNAVTKQGATAQHYREITCAAQTKAGLSRCVMLFAATVAAERHHLPIPERRKVGCGHLGWLPSVTEGHCVAAVTQQIALLSIFCALSRTARFHFLLRFIHSERQSEIPLPPDLQNKGCSSTTTGK